MLASHNLSKAAWGHLQRRDSQLMVHSFEMGVLFVPDLELLYRQHRHHGYCCSTGACRIRTFLLLELLLLLLLLLCRTALLDLPNMVCKEVANLNSRSGAGCKQ